MSLNGKALLGSITSIALPLNKVFILPEDYFSLPNSVVAMEVATRIKEYRQDWKLIG